MTLEHKTNLLPVNGLEAKLRTGFFGRLKKSLAVKVITYGLATLLSLGVAYGLSGCNDHNNDPNKVVAQVDADGDGFYSTSGFNLPVDCNDNNASIYPGAAEICNGIDDNCDGRTDEGLGLNEYYGDSDRDGYGSDANTIQSCAPPAGYVADRTDCNDADLNINPGVKERCNGIDDDCDGKIDEGSKNMYYRDSDTDGFGNITDSIAACTAPLGYVADRTDCNDADAGINPGIAEVCNGIDDNCNGQIDEEVMKVYYNDFDRDGFGDLANSTITCSQPIGFVTDSTDCNDKNAHVYPSATEVCDNIDNQCPGDAGYGTIDEACTYTECNDGIDNDGDTLTDYPEDYGCHGFADASEELQSIDILMTDLNFGNEDASGYITPDGLGFYFSRVPGLTWDIYYASRPDTSSSFDTPTLLSTISTGAHEGNIWVSDDEMRAYFSRSNGLYTASRTSKTDSFGPAVPISELNDSNNGNGPLLPDELTLFFESDRLGGLGSIDIWTSTRTSIDSLFGTPVNATGLNSSAWDGGLCMSRDGLTAFFSSSRSPNLGGGDLWYSWRSDLADPWHVPVRITELSTDKQEGFGTGCTNYSNELYYWRDVNGDNNNFEIFKAIR